MLETKDSEYKEERRNKDLQKFTSPALGSRLGSYGSCTAARSCTSINEDLGRLPLEERVRESTELCTVTQAA